MMLTRRILENFHSTIDVQVTIVNITHNTDRGKVENTQQQELPAETLHCPQVIADY